MFLDTFHGAFRVRLQDKASGELGRRANGTYVRVRKQFFHDELIVDLLANAPPFLVGFELLESFDLHNERVRRTAIGRACATDLFVEFQLRHGFVTECRAEFFEEEKS